MTLKSQSFAETVGKSCSLSNVVTNLVGHKLQAIGSYLATVRGEPVLRMKPVHGTQIIPIGKD